MACLKFLATCPCPRCLIPKSQVHQLGTVNDRRNRVRFKRIDDHPTRHTIQSARDKIYLKGISVGNSTLNRDHLGPKSLTPTRVGLIFLVSAAHTHQDTQSAFSIRFSEAGVNFYEIFAPDLLHEFELGVWKSVFIHLLRILTFLGQDKVVELNARYVLMILLRLLGADML